MHDTGATQKLLDYYTPELASMVTAIYREDFEVFGYPTWDGIREHLRLV